MLSEFYCLGYQDLLEGATTHQKGPPLPLCAILAARAGKGSDVSLAYFVTRIWAEVIDPSVLHTLH